tara:strand:+ start:513 stop:731 length:219 start_codon:yes stop_codon:yes gene_type:complete
MAKKIIYKAENGTLSVITPAENNSMTIEDIAKKDVPTGLSYKIIEDTDLPNSREFRNAWTIADNELTDGVGD